MESCASIRSNRVRFQKDYVKRIMNEGSSLYCSAVGYQMDILGKDEVMLALKELKTVRSPPSD